MPTHVKMRAIVISGPEEDEEEVDPELAEYLSGQKDVPLPMHFIGSFGRGAARGINMLLKAVAPGRVRHLGRAGLTSLQGLSVAYLDGTYDAQAYQEDAPPEDAPASCRHYTKVRLPGCICRSSLRRLGIAFCHDEGRMRADHHLKKACKLCVVLAGQRAGTAAGSGASQRRRGHPADLRVAPARRSRPAARLRTGALARCVSIITHKQEALQGAASTDVL